MFTTYRALHTIEVSADTYLNSPIIYYPVYKYPAKQIGDYVLFVKCRRFLFWKFPTDDQVLAQILEVTSSFDDASIARHESVIKAKNLLIADYSEDIATLS